MYIYTAPQVMQVMNELTRNILNDKQEGKISAEVLNAKGQAYNEFIKALLEVGIDIPTK